MKATEHKEALPWYDRGKKENPLWPEAFIGVIAVGMSAYHLYASAVGIPPAMMHRSIHLLFALALVFLTHPFSSERKRLSKLVDSALVGLSLVCMGFVILNFAEISERIYNVDPVTSLMTAFAFISVLMILEATRRVVGYPLALIALVFVVYAFIGPYLPGPISHQGVSLRLFVDHMYLTAEGIFGSVLGISATFVILFVILGSYLLESGAGQFFIDVAYATLGWTRGGPAKAAVVASSLFGTISGSAVANAGSVGPLTIPLMKKVGYHPQYAAAVESVASCGGQIMPPVMGAAAFIMADFLGVPYLDVCIAAAIPAILYYWALFMMVDLEAGKRGLVGLPRRELPQIGTVFREGWYFAVPIFAVIYLMAVTRYSPMMAAFWAILLNIALSWIRPKKAMGLKKNLAALQKGADGGLQVALACACVGIIIGVFTLTGLGLKLSSVLVNLAQGNFLLLLTLAMIASLILGTGLPTTPTYLFLAITVAPAMVALGMLPMAAHLFIFYFGAISDMTPPLAISAYVAAGIAGANPIRTTLTASKIGIAGYIIPFMFAYSSAYILKGGWAEILVSIVPGLVGIAALASAMSGYLLGKLSIFSRAALLAAAVLLIYPGFVTDTGGVILICAVIAKQIAGKKKILTTSAS